MTAPRCPITGDAQITRTLGTLGQPDQLTWDRADPEIHVTVELLDEISDEGRAFLEAAYELGEPCPYPDQPNTVHARLRATTKETTA